MITKTKLFNFTATINICLWFAYLFTRFIFQEGIYSYNSMLDALLVPGIFTLIVIMFISYCFKLSKAFNTKRQMSDGVRIVAPLFAALFTLLTVFFAFVTITGFQIFLSTDLLIISLINVLILGFTITSLYLCIAFWMMRQQFKKIQNNIINQIGSSHTEDAI